MIVVNLDVMMARRKMSLNELSERVGITLAAICKALDCRVEDILEFRDDGKGEDPHE